MDYTVITNLGMQAALWGLIHCDEAATRLVYFPDIDTVRVFLGPGSRTGTFLCVPIDSSSSTTE